MAPPRTELDPRFSDPGADPVDWATTERTMADAQLWWISTVRSDGRPHVTPLVAVWHDDALNFTTGPTEQKARNLEHDARVVVTTGCSDWQGGLDVVVEGTARRVTDASHLGQLAELWATKWDGSWEFEVGDGVFQGPGGTSHVFRVDPDKVLAFGKSPFSQTRHAFLR